MAAIKHETENGPGQALTHSAAGQSGSTPAASVSTVANASGQKRGREGESGDVPADKKWPGWPGENVFRLIVPAQKVGSIIGRKGELVKKMCEESKSRIKILEGALGTPDRIVLITAREEPDAPISPAMDGIMRVHKRILGIADSDGDDANLSLAGASLTQLLVTATQAGTLIGKQGATIKSIQETTGTSVRVVPVDESLLHALPDDRILEIQGEISKNQKALEMVIGHLRKFLVDRSVLPKFEKFETNQATNGAHDLGSGALGKTTMPTLPSTSQVGISTGYTTTISHDSLYQALDTQVESQSHHHGLSMYGKDRRPIGLRSSIPATTIAPIITQVIQKMQIPLSYADDVIGIGGVNIGYMRRASGATITIQETRGVPNEITVEIKGSSTQVQTAQQLVQNFMARGPEKIASTHNTVDTGFGSYTQTSNSFYPPTTISSHSIGGYGSSYGTSYGY